MPCQGPRPHYGENRAPEGRVLKPPYKKTRSSHETANSVGGSEMARIGRLLALAGRHQQAIVAQEVVFAADLHEAVAFGADEFAPVRLRVGIADISAGDGPWPRQGVIDNRDLVVHHIPV